MYSQGKKHFTFGFYSQLRPEVYLYSWSEYSSTVYSNGALRSTHMVNLFSALLYIVRMALKIFKTSKVMNSRLKNGF
jgi:hypothetical protein